VWPEGNRFFDPDLAEVLAYDPAAAKQLLTDAGHPDGIDVDLFVLPNRSSPEVAEVIEQQFAAVGIRATIINSPNYVADFLQPQKSGLGLIPSISNGRQRLTSFSGTGIGNACTYADPELDALVAELKGVTDSSDEAVEIWSDINQIITDDALGVFILWGSLIGAYNTQAFDDPVPWPIGSYILPDPYRTVMAED
jgi:ABC-type transport system substrate-binding protein